MKLNLALLIYHGNLVLEASYRWVHARIASVYSEESDTFDKITESVSTLCSADKEELVNLHIAV